MKSVILFILIVFSASGLKAQESLNYITVDTVSYNAYLNGNWDKIIDVANTAIEQDIDYYYLRMRLAYAYYMKKRYRWAIPHYLKAIEFNTQDETALEYLYNSYKYSGRENDAEKLINQFSESLKSSLIKDDRKLKAIGFYANFGFGSSADNSTKNKLVANLPNTADGVQSLINNSKGYNINLSHRIARSTIIRHNVNLLYKDVFAVYIKDNTSYISESQINRQINYHLAADINLAKGFTITPTYSFVNYRIPIYYSYGSGSGNNRMAYSYENYNQSAIGLKAYQEFNLFKLSIAGVYSNLNLGIQNTAAVSIAVYPLANLNLYYLANAYYHTQKDEQLSTQQFIHSHKLGFKAHNNLWIESSAMFGGFTNLYDPFSELTYNGLEQYNSIYGLDIIVPFHNSGISLFAAYRYYQSESMFVSSDNTLETDNYISFNYQSITGGLSWKF